MIRSNFHTHYNICDGHGEAEEYVKTALKNNFTSLGFSSHAPIPFESDWTMPLKDLPLYKAQMDTLKEKYKDQIEIYQGLEVDFPDYLKTLDFKPDYTIGSVHMLWSPKQDQYLAIDDNRATFEDLHHSTFKGSFIDMSNAYYQEMNKMIESSRPEIAGHIDLIKKLCWNLSFFNESDPLYKKQVRELLETIKEAGTFVEINTGGMSRGITKTPYPSLWILKECHLLDIPLVINSDCHRPEWINFAFDEAEALAKEAGYKEHMTLKNCQWIQEGF